MPRPRRNDITTIPFKVWIDPTTLELLQDHARARGISIGAFLDKTVPRLNLPGSSTPHKVPAQPRKVN